MHYQRLVTKNSWKKTRYLKSEAHALDMRCPVLLFLFCTFLFSAHATDTPIIEAKEIPSGPLFEVQPRDKDHPNDLVIRCYRNVQRITNDQRYRLFDHRLQRYDFKTGYQYKDGIFTEQDDFKRPLNPRIRLLPRQKKAAETGKSFIYYGYDSQIYLVENTPEIFLEPAKGERICSVSPFPHQNRIIITHNWGLPVTCMDIHSKEILWQWWDTRPLARTENTPNWDWYGDIYWLNSKYLAVISQGRKASLISIFDADEKQFAKGQDYATWFRIVGNRVLQIDDANHIGERTVSTYLSAEPDQVFK